MAEGICWYLLRVEEVAGMGEGCLTGWRAHTHHKLFHNLMFVI